MRRSEKITQTFSGLVRWEVEGGYFKLLSTVNPVTVELFLRGQKVHSAASVEGGYYQRIEFDRVEITTGGTETVSWLYAPSEGGSDRFTGDMTPTGYPKGAAHSPYAKTAGAASSQMLAPNANRKYLLVQNQDAAESVYLHTGGGAAAANNTCIRLGPGDVWEPTVPPTGAITMIRGGAADVLLHVIEA